jgi:hypothetical protein
VNCDAGADHAGADHDHIGVAHAVSIACFARPRYAARAGNGSVSPHIVRLAAYSASAQSG